MEIGFDLSWYHCGSDVLNKPKYLTAVGGKLYFNAKFNNIDYEDLGQSDGTSAGTLLFSSKTVHAC